MAQKMIDYCIDKKTEKEVEKLFYSESNIKHLEKVITDIESEIQLTLWNRCGIIKMKIKLKKGVVKNVQ